MVTKKVGIAYFLMVHKEPDQFERLIEAIWHPSNSYAIHIDRTAPSEMRRIAVDTAKTRSNVSIVPSVNCRHGGYSLVRAQQRGLRALLKVSANWFFFLHKSKRRGLSFKEPRRDRAASCRHTESELAKSVRPLG